jgi:hypothetical protein
MRWVREMKHTSRRRSRLVYACFGLAVMALGLLSRSDWVRLPPFLAEYAGDALWALLVFLGLAFLLPTRSTALVAGLAILFACAIELSQLYHAPWIDAIRRHRLAALVLGDTFVWADLAAYAVGIGTGAAAEWCAGLRR